MQNLLAWVLICLQVVEWLLIADLVLDVMGLLAHLLRCLFVGVRRQWSPRPAAWDHHVVVCFHSPIVVQVAARLVRQPMVYLRSWFPAGWKWFLPQAWQSQPTVPLVRPYRKYSSGQFFFQSRTYCCDIVSIPLANSRRSCRYPSSSIWGTPPDTLRRAPVSTHSATRNQSSDRM